jgi:hypothetical protein
MCVPSVLIVTKPDPCQARTGSNRNVLVVMLRSLVYGPSVNSREIVVLSSPVLRS